MHAINAIFYCYVFIKIGGVLGVLPLVIWLTAMTLFKDLMQSIREDLTLQPMESAKTVEKSCKGKRSTFYAAFFSLLLRAHFLYKMVYLN